MPERKAERRPSPLLVRQDVPALVDELTLLVGISPVNLSVGAAASVRWTEALGMAAVHNQEEHHSHEDEQRHPEQQQRMDLPTSPFRRRCDSLHVLLSARSGQT